MLLPKAPLSLQHDTPADKMKKFIFIITILILLFILIYSSNFYFLSRLSNSNSQPSRFKSHVEIKSEDSPFTGDLNDSNLKSIYLDKNPKFELLKDKILKNFVPCSRKQNYSEIWDEANSVS